MMLHKLARAVVAWLSLLACAVPASAQKPAEAPYQPPAMRFDGPGLTLLDAVRLTLQHDPNIKVREAQRGQSEGVLRAEKGRFDFVLGANGSFSRGQQGLLETVIQQEQTKRDDLRTTISDVTQLSNSLLAAGRILGNKDQVYNNPSAINFTAGIGDVTVADQMTILQSQLILYRDILASPQLTDARVKTDIAALREVTLGKNIDFFNAQQAAIAGVPGQLQAQLDRLGATPTAQWDRLGRVSFDLSREFRSGLFVRPFVDLNYSAQNYLGKAKDPLDGGMGIAPIYRGKVGFDVVLPIARGAGQRSVAAGEIAARYDLEASRLALLHQQSQSVFSTVQAYWQARAAAEQVEVLRRSVELQGELGNMTRALIAAKEKPRADEARVLASTADARSRYEAAQRQLSEARITLARVMGVALADALSIPLAADRFPQPPQGLTADPQGYAALIRESVARRYDRQAALQAEASGKALVEGARIDTRHLVNLTASAWGTSVHQDTPGYNNWVFRSGSAGISYERPFGNNAARGLLEQRVASHNQARIDSANMERTIALNVAQFAESLKIAADRLRAAEEAVRNYEQTIVSEQARFKAGDTSLLDTLLTEQQTTSARLALVSAQQDYASLLAALQYEAGLLVHDNAVDASTLVAVPAALVRR
jgi:outer membrane protein TolC